MRVVFDTNVLIDAVENDFSPQAKLLEAARNGQIEVIVTTAVKREYDRLLRRLIEDTAVADKLRAIVESASVCRAKRARVQIDDREDKKFIEAALGGNADVIVTRDGHLLDVGEIETTEIVTPQEAWVRTTEVTSGTSEWKQWAQDLGL